MKASHDVSPVLRTLADPTRRMLYERIVREGPVTTGELARGAVISQPAVSQHLKALRESRLVKERREGRNVHYSAAPEGLGPLITWLDVYGAFWRKRFANLRNLLKEVDHDRGRSNLRDRC
jgi:DNA-binding transcriptional ArsR family regulator